MWVKKGQASNRNKPQIWDRDREEHGTGGGMGQGCARMALNFASRDVGKDARGL